MTTASHNSGSSLRRALVDGVLPLSRAGILTVRVVGAALLVANGWLHWHLDDIGYSTVPTIGPLFRLNAVLAVLLAVAVLLTPMPWWRYACAAGALLQIGTLAGLGLSLTVGIMGFKESLDAPDLPLSVVVESIGFVVLAIGALARRREREHEGL